MHLILASNCVECCPERFQMQAATDMHLFANAADFMRCLKTLTMTQISNQRFRNTTELAKHKFVRYELVVHKVEWH